MKAAIIGLVMACGLTAPAMAGEACAHSTLPQVLEVVRSVPSAELFGISGADADKFNAAVFDLLGSPTDTHPVMVLVVKGSNGNILGFAFDATGCEIAGGPLTDIYDAALKASGVVPQDLGAGTAIPEIKLPVKDIEQGKNGYLLRA